MNSTAAEIHKKVRERMESIENAPSHETYRVWLHTIDDTNHEVFLTDTDNRQLWDDDETPEWTVADEQEYSRTVYGTSGVMVSVEVSPRENPIGVADHLIDLNDEMAIQS